MKTKGYVVAWVALVVGLLALGTVVLAGLSGGSKSDTLGGVYNVNNSNPTFTNGIDMGTYPVTVNWDGNKIGSKQYQASWKNTTGQTQYITYAEVSTDGTASTSFKVYAFSTTTAPASIAYNVTPLTNVLINGFVIATSSAATTTTSDDTKGTGSGPLAGSTIQVPTGSYFIVSLQANAAANFETATSTKRGFNLPWRIEYHN